MGSKVSITKSPTITEVAQLKEVLLDLLAPLGGLDSIVDEGEIILLKPNLVLDVSYVQGAITNPYLIKALIELIREKFNYKQIIIADGASVGNDTGKVFRETEYEEVLGDLLAADNIKKFDFKQGEFKREEIKGGQVLNELYIPQLLDKVDTIINLPVPKTHDALPITLGLKNMKGIIREGAKKKFHRIGLSQAIVDLNKLVGPDITIYDGTVAMEGLGPAHGTPVNFKTLLSSKDVLAGDVAAAKLMGVRKEEVPYLQLASEQGIGVGDLAEIELICEEDIEKISYSFTRYNLESSFYQAKNINLEVEKSCSGCKHTLDGIVEELPEEVLDNLARATIYMGLVEEEKVKKKKAILIGKCVQQYKERGKYIEGCPPHPEDLAEFLESVGDRI